MIARERIPRLLSALFVSGLIFVILTSWAYADDLEDSLRAQYAGKILVLRGFYHADKLRYDSSGTLVGSGVPGDWTVDGIVRVVSIDVSGRGVTVHCDRLNLLYDGSALAFQAQGKNKKVKKASRLRIEAQVAADALTADGVRTLLSKIFLMPPDRFADIVPDYWKPCVLAASAFASKNHYPYCKFTAELASVPALASGSDEGNDSDAEGHISNGPISSIGSKGVVPPKPRFTIDPDFSTEARELGYQGSMTLLLVVDTDGKPAEHSNREALGSRSRSTSRRVRKEMALRPGSKGWSACGG